MSWTSKCTVQLVLAHSCLYSTVNTVFTITVAFSLKCGISNSKRLTLNSKARTVFSFKSKNLYVQLTVILQYMYEYLSKNKWDWIRLFRFLNKYLIIKNRSNRASTIKLQFEVASMRRRRFYLKTWRSNRAETRKWKFWRLSTKRSAYRTSCWSNWECRCKSWVLPMIQRTSAGKYFFTDDYAFVILSL